MSSLTRFLVIAHFSQRRRKSLFKICFLPLRGLDPHLFCSLLAYSSCSHTHTEFGLRLELKPSGSQPTLSSAVPLQSEKQSQDVNKNS